MFGKTRLEKDLERINERLRALETEVDRLHGSDRIIERQIKSPVVRLYVDYTWVDMKLSHVLYIVLQHCGLKVVPPREGTILAPGEVK